MNILGIDHGTKKIGLAMTDTDTNLSRGIGIIKGDNLMSYIIKIVKERNIQKIIVGLPLSKFGTKGKQAQIVEDWIEDLKAEIPKDIDIETIDERFTSGIAKDDELSACYILDIWMGKLKNLSIL